MITITITVADIIITNLTNLTNLTNIAIIISSTTIIITTRLCRLKMSHSLNHVAGVHEVDKLSLFRHFPDGVLVHEICTCRRSTC